MNVSLVAEFDKEFRKRRAIFVIWKVSCARANGGDRESDRLIFSMALRHPYRAVEHAQVLVPDCRRCDGLLIHSLCRAPHCLHTLVVFNTCLGARRWAGIWLQKVRMQVQGRIF